MQWHCLSYSMARGVHSGGLVQQCSTEYWPSESHYVAMLIKDLHKGVLARPRAPTNRPTVGHRLWQARLPLRVGNTDWQPAASALHTLQIRQLVVFSDMHHVAHALQLLAQVHSTGYSQQEMPGIFFSIQYVCISIHKQRFLSPTWAYEGPSGPASPDSCHSKIWNLPWARAECSFDRLALVAPTAKPCCGSTI